MKTIDFHTHVFSPDMIADRERLTTRDRWFGELYTHPGGKMATAEELLRSMDRSQVARSVMCGFPWKDKGLLREGNDYVFDAARRYPDRLIGFLSVHPNETEACEAELARIGKEPVRGIGEIMPDGNGFHLSDVTVMKRVARFACEHGLPLLTHTSEPVGHQYPGKGRTYAQVALELARAFPDLKLVCGHWGGGLIFYELIPEVARALGNVYYDTAASCYLYDSRVFEVAMKIVPQKVLFATDYPMATHTRMLKHLSAAKITHAQRDAVLFENAHRLLGLSD